MITNYDDMIATLKLYIELPHGTVRKRVETLLLSYLDSECSRLPRKR